MDLNVIVTLIAVAVAVIVGIGGRKIVRRHFKKEEAKEKWIEVRREANKKGYELNLYSDEEFEANKLLPRGRGIIFRSGTGLCVRYEHTNPKEVLEFLKGIPAKIM